MCSTLSFKENTYKIGDRVTAHVYPSDQVVQGTWSGFIKQENVGWWQQQKAIQPVEVDADAFAHRKLEFEVPNSRVLAYILTKDVKFKGKIIGKRGEIKILTRGTINRFESTVHDRWPVVKTGPVRRLFAFQPWDMKGVPPAAQQELDLRQAGE